MDESDLNQVTVDTTMQKNAVKYPTDAKLLNRVRDRLVNKVQSAGLTLHQSYVQVDSEAIFEEMRGFHQSPGALGSLPFRGRK